MSVDSFALPMPKTGDSHLSPLAARFLYSVALVEIPPGSEMFLKMESFCVIATLTFMSLDFSSAFFLLAVILFWRAVEYCWYMLGAFSGSFLADSMAR